MYLANGQYVSLAPQMLSDRNPTVAGGWYSGHTGLFLHNRFATYAALYRTQPWVAAPVDKISNGVARLSLKVWSLADPENKSEDTTGAFAKLLDAPYSGMTRYQFYRWFQATYEIYGEAFLLKLRDENGKVAQLIPMHPAVTQVERAGNGVTWPGAQPGDVRYRFTTNPNQFFSESDVVPYLRYNPDDTMRGISRLEPLRSTYANELAARTATASWWEKMGRPSMVLSTDKRLTPDAKERLKKSWDSTHGGAGNAGGTVVLEEGLKADAMQLTAEEMQYIESRRMNREEVCSVYDIPPTALHILDNATYSNITEQFVSLYRDTMMPRLEELENVINTYVGVEFPGNRVAKFAVDEMLRGDFQTRAASASELVNSGIYMPAEARQLFDLNDAGPESHKLYANSAMQPLGQEPPKPAETQPEPDNTADAAENGQQDDANLSSDETSADETKHYRSICGRLGRGKSIEEIAAEFNKKKSQFSPDEFAAICRAIEKAKGRINGSNH